MAAPGGRRSVRHDRKDHDDFSSSLQQPEANVASATTTLHGHKNCQESVAPIRWREMLRFFKIRILTILHDAMSRSRMAKLYFAVKDALAVLTESAGSCRCVLALSGAVHNVLRSIRYDRIWSIVARSTRAYGPVKMGEIVGNRPGPASGTPGCSL